MTTTLPADLAADLAAHGIDPARVICERRGFVPALASVRLVGKPARVAVSWYDGLWALKRSGRYVTDPNRVGGCSVRLFASAGAALSWEPTDGR